jgi:hypothetical protein
MLEPDDSDLLDHAAVLSHRDQVALWAGRIVRKEAQIESMLRTVYYELSGSGLSWAVVPQNFAPLSRDIRTMLKAASLDADYLADCLKALDRLDAAHLIRNRVVHDQWVEHAEAPGQFVNAAKGVSGPTTKPEVVWQVGEFEKCYRELRFCYAMISGMYWSIGCYIGDRHEFFRDMLPSNRETLAGRINLTGENHWTFTDPQFAEELRAEMQRRGAELQQRMAEWRIERGESENYEPSGD